MFAVFRGFEVYFFIFYLQDPRGTDKRGDGGRQGGSETEKYFKNNFFQKNMVFLMTAHHPA